VTKLKIAVENALKLTRRREKSENASYRCRAFQTYFNLFILKSF